ncbi:MAG TPA: NAD(P)/FAD-dependent oxidoreductase [Planctomycetota bacterium]|nr:NAD(P)/FAD-dependent oxidoreductase [Planctomycetota bacterium]
MFAHKNPEVLVVGAGPVGLFTALALVQRGVRVQIIEKEPGPSRHSYALALHAESLRLFEEVGALHDVLERARRVRRVGIYDATGRRTELQISDVAEDYSFLAVLPQADIEDHLVNLLAKRGVKVEWSHELSQLEPHDDRVGVRVDRLSLDTLGYTVQHTEWVVAKSKQRDVPFVVGADGHASLVRRRLGIEFPTVGPSSNFAVFEFHTDAELGDEMRLVLDGATRNACWPLDDGFCRWSFELPELAFDTDADSEDRRKDHDGAEFAADHDRELDEDRLRQLLAERAPWFRGRIGEMRWRKIVHFERRLAETFGRGRVWLVGDAGHLANPIGMHSMNVGFREGAQLADTVATALRGTKEPAAFERFDAARRVEWLGLLGLDGVLQALPAADPWVVERGARLAECIPATGADQLRLAGQIGLVHRRAFATTVP